MSFFVVSPFEAASPVPIISRCGPSFASVEDHRTTTSNAIPRGLLGALFGGADEDVVFDEEPYLNPWQQHQLEQLRRQEYLREVERRRRILVAKQKQAELERKLEQVRREKAARLAWHQEQQRRAAIALDYQRQVEEAYKRRQQEEYAQQVRYALKSQQILQAQREQHAEQARRVQQSQQPQQKEIDWEKVAAQSLFGVIDLVQHLFGEDEVKTTSQVDGKKREKTSEEVVAEQTKRNDVNDMQLDQPESSTEQAGGEQVVVANEKEVVPETSTQEITETISATEQDSEQETKAGRLVFTYPLPQEEAARSGIKAQDIGVSYDEVSHTIQLTGLWPNESASGTSSSTVTGSENGHEESRGRKRSRSPKHSRVSDVDEKTGEEIIKADENEEGFVEVPKVQTTTKSIRLPQDAAVAHLRAELTDEGFKVFV